MPVSNWSIDSSLQLHPVNEIPSAASPLHPPEQLIDTVLLRNLDCLCTSLIGQQAKFLFHSTEYWGPFDVGCVLADGRVAAFENKSKSVTKDGLVKFCRDIRIVNEDPDKYICHRFEHVIANLDDYIATAKRMFAGFFLGLRCDTEKSSRDMAADACEFLSVDREQFHADFCSGNSWLECIRSCSGLTDYLEGFAEVSFDDIVPLFLVPDSCVQRVRSWIPEDAGEDAATAVLATYQFYANDKSYPQWLLAQVVDEICVPLED